MKRRDKGRLPPFVPLLKETMATAAWQALSHGARSLYVSLKHRYNPNSHNNGRIYLSTRAAAKELGSWRGSIIRWFRELQHYGFIVQTSGGCLGVDGKGKAPHWRLTELGHMRNPPTRDFADWSGVKFTAPEKQNPGPETRATLVRKPRPVVVRKPGPVDGGSGPETRAISVTRTGPETSSQPRPPDEVIDLPAFLPRRG
jgi:hypothetical protein